jgi:hypothetical protein
MTGTRCIALTSEATAISFSTSDTGYNPPHICHWSRNHHPSRRGRHGRPDPNQCRLRRLGGIHARHRHPGDLRACGEVALTRCRDVARSEVTLPEIDVVNRPYRSLTQPCRSARISYQMAISQHLSSLVAGFLAISPKSGRCPDVARCPVAVTIVTDKRGQV